MFRSARPSSFGNAGADFVSLKDRPRSVERRIFMPKNGLQLEAYRRGAVPRPSISAEYTATPGPNGPRRANFLRVFAASATNRPFFVPTARSRRSVMIDLRRRRAGS
jgi:hypothetical protein